MIAGRMMSPPEASIQTVKAKLRSMSVDERKEWQVRVDWVEDYERALEASEWRLTETAKPLP